MLNKKYEQFKADTRNVVDITILSIDITIFALIASLKSELLTNNVFLAAQLVLSMPLIMSTIFCRIKIPISKQAKSFDKLAAFSFTIGYGFFINVIGIILSYYVSFLLVLLYFATNAILSFIRYYIELRAKKPKAMATKNLQLVL